MTAMIESTHRLDFDLVQCDWLVEKVRGSRVYAQNLYSALCNREWQERHVFEVLSDRTWSCSWRTAGEIVADIRDQGDYLDWYCSGLYKSHPDDDLGLVHSAQTGYVSEGTITDEIRTDLAVIGWRPVQVDQNINL